MDEVKVGSGNTLVECKRNKNALVKKGFLSYCKAIIKGTESVRRVLDVDKKIEISNRNKDYYNIRFVQTNGKLSPVVKNTVSSIKSPVFKSNKTYIGILVEEKKEINPMSFFIKFNRKCSTKEVINGTEIEAFDLEDFVKEQRQWQF